MMSRKKIFLSTPPAHGVFLQANRTRSAKVSCVSLFRRYPVELSGPLLIKESALALIAAAPMFVATRNKEIFSWPNALVPGFVLIEVGAFDNDEGNIVRVGVRARIESGLELGKRCVRTLVGIAQ